MRRLKRSTTLLQRSRDRFRSRRVAERTRFCEKNRARTPCLAPKRAVVARLAVSSRDDVVANPGSTATQRRGYTISIGREDGSRCFRSGLPAKSRIFGGSSELAWRRRARFLLARSHRCSMRQTLLPQPLPLSLRRTASYGWLADETDA